MPTKITIEQINDYMHCFKMKCLETHYRNPNLRMRFECEQGHVFKKTWGELREKKTFKCPTCNGEWDTFYGKESVLSKNPYCTYDGKVFDTKREYTHYMRDKKNKTVPHEIAITKICDKFSAVERYGFGRRVLEELASYYAGLSCDVEYVNMCEEINKPVCGMCGQCTATTINTCIHRINEGWDLISPLDSVKDMGFSDILYKVVPDAFSIDQNKEIVDVIEVEDTSRLSLRKLISYASIWGHLDFYFEWDFNLVLFDRFGHFMGFIDLPIYEFCFWHSIDQEKGFNKDVFLENVSYCEDVVPYDEFRLVNYCKSSIHVPTK